jgi:PDZ domain-containing protein
MARFFKLLIAGGLVLAAVVGLLYIIPSNEYIFLPDKARPLAPYVTVKGERADRDGGGIYYVAVEVKKASLLEKLFPGLREGSTLVPAAAVVSPGQSDQQHQRQEIQAMAQSQEIGAAVALKQFGYRVPIKSPGTVIADVNPNGPSAGKLQANDAIAAVDGQATPSLPALRRQITKHSPGQSVALTVRRDGAVRTVDVKTAPDPQDKKRSIIGVLTSCALQTPTKISLPVPVHIDLGQVGGPSAGLAFALDVAEKLGHDVDRGHRVVASGEMCLDGSVLPVGGLKQKTIGARRAGADVFLVPAGENAQEARRYAGNMRVIPVHTYRQALRALAPLN